MKFPKLPLDRMSALLLLIVLFASVFPCRGEWAERLAQISSFMIALLFFMHGAKLSREALLAGVLHWRLHAATLGCTFLLFPMLGLLGQPILSVWMPPELMLGLLFVCVLPSTVQSSIAFTAMARGNVAAAVCSASVSNLLGIVLTPLWVKLVVMAHGDQPWSWQPVWKIVEQLLLPFLAGQLARPWLRGWIEHHRAVLQQVDQSAILLVVYVAFSAAVEHGIWHQVPWTMLLKITIVSALLLALVLQLSWSLGRALKFDLADRIVLLFCGSKKSLASGVPMAQVLFDAHVVGVILLPLMLFHQLQLMVCAMLAQRFARRM